MEPFGIPITKKIVYGYTEPGSLSSFTYGSFSSFIEMHHFILVFTQKQIVLIGLTMMGDFANSHACIPVKDIELFNTRKGLIQYKLTLKIKGEKKMKFKADKVIAIAKRQFSFS